MNIQRIGLLTSGGDAPGLNACIRAVVKTAVVNKVEVVGIRNGFEGMINGDFMHLHLPGVNDIIRSGGTILKSSRSERFKTREGRALAFEKLREQKIDMLILIGGDGSFEGARIFAAEYPVNFIGIPKTIDNDLSGTDVCIGYDTALNTAMQAIDRIRDTAQSHNRLFLVEVMGRDLGFIAYGAALAAGADAVLLPETKIDMAQLQCAIEAAREKEASSFIAVVAEGDESGGALRLADRLKKEYGLQHTGICILGHTQRGGSPSAADRILAARFGYAAVNALISGKKNGMVGIHGNEIAFTPLGRIKKRHFEPGADILEMLFTLEEK